jgi:hypothetical protein
MRGKRACLGDRFCRLSLLRPRHCIGDISIVRSPLRCQLGTGRKLRPSPACGFVEYLRIAMLERAIESCALGDSGGRDVVVLIVRMTPAAERMRSWLLALEGAAGYGRCMRDADVRVLSEILDAHGSFGHRQHLELAWTYLQRNRIDDAAEAMVAAIQHVAQLHGAEDKYHETITRAWLHCVAAHSHRWGANTFEEFIERNPDLLNQHLIAHFYSRELIESDNARAAWIEPDLRPLPVLA